MNLRIEVDYEKRRNYWLKYGKMSKSNKRMLLKDFDSKVYALGLQSLKERGFSGKM